jgi:DNA polymerase-1
MKKKLKLKKIPKRIKPTTTLLVDLKYLCYRLKYTSGSQLSYDEVDTTIKYGILSTLISLAKKFQIDKCVITCDIGRNKDSRRREQYPLYKVKDNKYKTPVDIKLDEVFSNEYEELVEEFKEMGFGANYVPRYEADDLIAIYCKEHTNENIIVITRDEDIYQCLDNHVTIYSPDDKVKKHLNWFKKEYGIESSQWSKVKALAGCKSDNVKGIERIGEKTAIAYLKGEATENQEKKIKDNWDIYQQCYKVVELPHNDLKDIKFDFVSSEININEFVNYCQKYGLRSILDELNNFKLYF